MKGLTSLRVPLVFEMKVLCFEDQVAAAHRLLDVEIAGPNLLTPLTSNFSQFFQGSNSAFVSRSSRLDAFTSPGLFLCQLLIKELLLFLASSQVGFFAFQERLVIATPVKKLSTINL